MMAKRELSSTLKNLKFMRRAAPKEEKPEVEDVKVERADGFTTPASLNRKCIVIMEENPQPTGRGRMSFNNFNPAVDRMYESSNAESHQNPPSSEREETQPTASENSSRDLKRKQADLDSPHSEGQKPQKSQNCDGNVLAFTPNHGKSAHKQKKREKKLDWNVLRPPNPGARQSGS